MMREVASRRTKAGTRRDHRIGPLRLNDDELRAVRSAADRVGLSLGAYATDAVVRAAHAELDGLRVKRERLKEVRELQVALTRLQVDLNNPTFFDERTDELIRMLCDLLVALQRSGRGPTSLPRRAAGRRPANMPGPSAVRQA